MSGLRKLITHGPGYFIGRAGELKEFAGSKEGSLFSGRFLQEGGIKDRDMESARTFDIFGSPATAGTGAQPYARAGAVLYGLGAAGAAYAGGTAGSSGGAYSAGPYGGFDSGAIGATDYGAGAAGTGSATASSPWQQQMRSMPQQGQQQPQQEYQVEDYTEEDEQNRYWQGRAAELRMMADRAVRRYLT